MKTTKSRISFLSVLLALLMLCGSFVAVPVSAVSLDSELDKKEDILWELDFAKMQTVDDNLGNPGYSIQAPKSVDFYEIDGQKCLGFKNACGQYFIDDVDNILKEYDAYYMEADMYFESYPSGEAGGETPHTYPMSFMTWVTGNDSGSLQFGSIRIDDEGYLCTKGAVNSRLSSTAKLPLNEWFNIRFVISPSGRRCEVFVNHESVGSYGISMLKNNDITLSRLRFFDSRYSYSVYFKNISITSDADYRIGLSKEVSADYLGYQTTKVEDGKFDVRFLASMSSMDFQTAGYTVYRLTDDFGEAFVEEFVLKSKQVYESVNQTAADGTTVVRNASEFNTKYLSAITLTDMSVDENATLVIRPWLMTDGVKTYGTPQKLVYAGIVNDGYPVFSEAYEATQYELTATEDTYTGGKYQKSSDSSAHGSETILTLKNSGDTRSDYTRRAYIKFELPAKAIEMIAGAYQVRLEFCGKQATIKSAQETADGGVTAVISGVDTKWTEAELTRGKEPSQIIVLEENIGTVVYKTKEYAAVDVTEYVQEYAIEGELAFCIENESKNEFESTLYSREAEGGAYAPRLVIVPSNLSLNYEVALGKLENIGYEPWGYAEQLVNEWFDGGERDKLYADEYEPIGLDKVDNNAANGDYSVYNPIYNTKSNTYVRTLSTLSGYKMEEKTLFDEFGGIMNLGVKGRATGYFHTERINGKVYIIDPIGNPYYSLAVNTVSTGASTNQRKLTIEQYGSEEEFYAAVATDLLGNFGINAAYTSDATANAELIKNGMTVVVSTGGISSYMGSLGLSVSTGGSSEFFYNDTMNVFDPDFITFADAKIKAAVEPYVNEPYLLGYTSDNEICGGDNFLERYLTIPASEPVNAFSYATAWTWFCRATESINPSLDDITPELSQEFLAFVYNRYFKIIDSTIEKYDPNHMYIGTRAHTPTKDKEGYLRAAGQYLDVITTNMYGRQNYAEINRQIDKIYQYSGLPIIVSEFGMRALESVDMNGYQLGNYGDTACWLFETQQQRANSYESYILNLLESNNCVGWVLYRFRDNDQSVYEDKDGNKYLLSSSKSAEEPTYQNIETGVKVKESEKEIFKVYSGETDTSNLSHNKGIYDNYNQPYPEMMASMKAISENLVSLIKFFAK
jgi:hypothetical protein